MTMAWNRSRGVFHSAETYQIARYIDVSGIGRWDYVHFPAEIRLLRESCSCLVLRHRSGDVVKKHETNNDFYGYLTSPRDPLEHFVGWKNRYAGGELVVEIDISIVDTPCLYKEPDQKGHAPQYLQVPNDWMVSDARIEALKDASWEVKSANPGEFFRPMTVLDEPLMSSSWLSEDRTWARSKMVEVLERAQAGIEVSDWQRERMSRTLAIAEEMLDALYASAGAAVEA